MLGHLSFGVADLERAIAFYEAALAPLGLHESGQRRTRRVSACPEAVTFSHSSSNQPRFGLRAPVFILPSTLRRTPRSSLSIPKRCARVGLIMAVPVFAHITGRPIMRRS